MRTNRFARSRAGARAVIVIVGGVLGAANCAMASLLVHYQMNSPTALINSAGAASLEPNLVDPGSPASPSYAATSGVNGSGAFQFDGVNDHFTFSHSGTMYTGLNAAEQFVPGFTTSFWIATTDA